MDIITQEIKVNGIPESWTDTIQMQALYSHEDKGYKKKVMWQQSTIDSSFAGVFAAEFIRRGEVIRVLEKDKNMIILNSKVDLPPLTDTFMKYVPDYIGNAEDLYLIFIPGMSCNHHATNANIWIEKISDSIVHVTARKDINKGNELFLDYHSMGNGAPPEWLADFAIEHNVPLNYKGFCDFL